MQPFTRLRHFSQRQQDLLALLLILLVALAFRTWRLDSFPPGLFGDEAVNGLDALDVLAGRPQVFFPANYGREGLHMLVLAPFIQLLGASALALRLPSVIAGILTALATYWLGRELLARTRLSGPLLPLLAALLLATSYWHVHFSRFGIRGVFTPLFATLTYAAFWAGVNRIRRNDPFAKHPVANVEWAVVAPLPWFLLAGLFMGVGAHFYTASRLVPVFLGGYLVLQWLIWLLATRKTQNATHPPILRRAFWPVVLMYAVAAAVFAPLGLYFLRTPGSFARRASAVSLTNPEISGGDPLGRLWQAISANLMQFVIPGRGDQAAFYNLPGRAVFDPLTGLLAGVGLLLCLWTVWRWLRGNDRAAALAGSPLLFLLTWFPAMLLPTFLAVDRFPTLPRALGVLPGIYFFPALALAAVARQIGKPAKTAGLALGLGFALLLVWHGSLTWRDYFRRWGPSAQVFDAFEGDMTAAADWLADHPGQEVYLSSDLYRHPSLVFLHEQTPLTEFLTYQDPGLHFFDGRNSLPLPPPGQPATYLFTHNAGPDPLLAQAPGWPGFSAWNEQPGPGGPALVVARLDARPDLPASATPVTIQFDSQLQLVGYQVVSDEAGAAVYLWWRMAGPELEQPHGLQVQAGLTAGAADQQIAQASAELSYRATEWAQDSGAISWLRLPLPADSADELRLALRLVNQANGATIQPAGADDDGWLVLPLP